MPQPHTVGVEARIQPPCWVWARPDQTKGDQIMANQSKLYQTTADQTRPEQTKPDQMRAEQSSNLAWVRNIQKKYTRKCTKMGVVIT